METPQLRFRGFNDSWEKKAFDDCVVIKSKLIDPQDDKYSDYPHIGTANMEKHSGKLLDYKLVKEENLISGKYVFGEQDIIYGKINPQLGKVVFPKFKGLCSADAYPLSAKKNVMEPGFLFQQLLTPRFLKYSISVSMRTGMPKINRSELSGFKFILPSLNEQKKIASFFSLLDGRVEKQQAKIEALKEQRKGLLQKMFPQRGEHEPSFRFNGFMGEWEEKQLRDLFEIRDERQIPTIEAPLMAFTSTGGVEEKGDRYNREFLVKNKSKKYKRTEFNDLIYSSNNLDVGAIGRNKYGTAVISDVYEIFKTKEGVTPEFSELIIQQKNFLNKVLKYRQGALYGQYRIHADDFLSVEINVPSLKEQTKIGRFFSLIDRHIKKEEQKLEALKEQKKGFMQQMFI
ncbi:restriction endonuclease subunit S [Salinibacillus xinjiangensis]|uniref:Type I restriction modification DNA specificity domain-containing protein n=1 Tax=Salinibacillus xinjiangensis TaxID=1229268 RepID=A0A6G1X6Y6_9BACI|nr:restriction endonuclease subunit S [Salinibacillus xinjiangensis]MRG86707.1 hypothetical protein [Salinibacillus xinjiangensis]